MTLTQWQTAKAWTAKSSPLEVRLMNKVLRMVFCESGLDLFLNSFLLLVVWPGAASSVLAPSSDARSP